MGAIPEHSDRIQEVVRALEEEIVLGRLYPREHLVEQQLAARFGIGRHIVRLVLAELERVGLILRLKGRGAIVCEFDCAEVDELYTMRDLLEGEAAMKIRLPLPVDQIADLRALAESYAAAVAALDMQSVIRDNKAFHQRVYGHCGNRFLSGAIDQMAQRSNLVRFSSSVNPAFLARARDEHFAIVAALEGHDNAVLAELCIAHIQPAREHYLALRRQREPN